jgi:hypothetical protein
VPVAATAAPQAVKLMPRGQHVLHPRAGSSTMAPPSTQPIRLDTSTMSLVASSTVVTPVVESTDYIPRPRNAFIIFRADRSKKYQGRTASDISQLVAAEWKLLPADVKARYERQADEEKRRHKVQYPHYRFQPKQKPKVKDKEERKKIETKVAEKLEERRAQKRAARARAKKRQEMERAMQQIPPMPLPMPMPLGYPSRLDSTSHLPFIPVLIPNPAYIAQVPTSTVSTHVFIDSALPPLAPPSPPSPAAPGLDSGPVTPVVAGSPVRAPIEANTTGEKENRNGTAMSPIIASASPIQQAATTHPLLLEWPATFDPIPVYGTDTFTPEDPYAWFGHSMPPLSSREFDGSFYSNPFGSTSSLQLSEGSNDSGDWSTLMDEMLGKPHPDSSFSPLHGGSSDWPVIPYTSAVVSLNDPVLTSFPSASASTLAAAGRTRPRPDGFISCDATFNAGLSASPEWGNCLGLENSHAQGLNF